MPGITEYSRQESRQGNYGSASLVRPDTGSFEALDRLAAQVTAAAVQSKNADRQARAEELVAGLKTQLLERQIKNFQVLGSAVEANPNAPSSSDAFEDGSLSLFDRNKQGLENNRDAFLAKANGDEILKDVLASEYDKASLDHLTKTGEWYLGQKEIYRKNSQEKGAQASAATFLAEPEFNLKNLQTLKSEMLATFHDNPAEAQKRTNAATVEGFRQFARKDARRAEEWLSKNEASLDRLAPGVTTALQDITRDERTFQAQQLSLARTEQDRREKKWKEAQTGKAVSIANQVRLGLYKDDSGNVVPAATAAREINDMPGVTPDMRKTLVNNLLTPKPILTDYAKLANYNVAAATGTLDTAKLDQDVVSQNISVEAASTLRTQNEQALTELDEVSKEQFKGAISYLKSMFSSSGMFGDIFADNTAKQQFNMAVNRLRRQYYAQEKGSRDELFKFEKVKGSDGEEYEIQPRVEEIFKWAKSLPVDTASQITSIPSASKALTDDEVDAQAARILGD